MAHLRHLGLKNFRVFGNDAPMLSLAPITLVTGANNSGKSSIIKALLLLQKSIQKYPRLEKLDFTGGGHHLGNYGNTFSKGEEGSMIFAVPFPIFFNPNFVLELHYVGNTGENQRDFSPILIRSKIFEFPSKKTLLDVWEISVEKSTPPRRNWDKVVGKFGVKFNTDLLKALLLPIYEKWSKHKDELEATKRKFKGRYRYGIEIFKEGIRESIFNEIYGISPSEREDNHSLQLLGFDSISATSYSEKIINVFERLETVLTNGLPQSISSEHEITYGEEQRIYSYYFYNQDESPFGKFLDFYPISRELSSLMGTFIRWSFEFLKETLASHLSHLPSERGNLSRLYQTEGDAFNQLIQALVEQESHNNIGYGVFLNKWIKEFGIEEFEKMNINPLYEYGVNQLQFVSADGKSKSFLVDLGYGTLQLVTILFKILVESQKHPPSNYEDPRTPIPPIIIMIEEPEANLHPRWQSLLAEMFVEAAQKFKIQFILETHSEYLIRNLQNLVAKKTIPPEAVQIFYITEKSRVEDDSKQVESIQIAEDGALDYAKFKSGFFDEQYNLHLSLLNIQRDQFLEEIKVAKEALISSEDKISKLEAIIDEYDKKKDLKIYELEVEALLGGSSYSKKLCSKTQHYFASAKFLYSNLDKQEVFILVEKGAFY